MEMALRASTTSRPSFSSSSSLPGVIRASSVSKRASERPQIVSFSVALPTSVSLFALFSAPHEAKALSKDQIVSSLTEMEKTIDQVQEVSSNVFDQAKGIFEVVAEAVKPALPVLQQAGEKALDLASPVISEASKKAQEAMQNSGFDVEPVMTAAKTVAGAAQQTTKVIEDAKPLASSTVDTISSAEPTVIVAASGALFVSYFLLPPIWSAISFSLRGYQGELTPAQTLDLMCTRNHVLIDIRSEKDKDKTGIPRLPSSAQSNMIAIPLEELPSKLRGLVRNSKNVEAEIAALKISFLKRVGKGSNIVIMDSYSDSAKIVARYLTSLGFKNCWIVTDGFSGGRGWLQSRLGTDSYNLSFAEVLSPSRILSGRFGTTSTKALPGPN